MINLESKRIKKASGDDLIEVITRALNGYPLIGDIKDDGSMGDIKETSEWRKLRYSVKVQYSYVVLYLAIESGVKEIPELGMNEVEFADFTDSFRTKYGNAVSWRKSARKFSETKTIKAYTNEVIEYKEVTSVDSLNFMIIPIQVWNDRLKEWEAKHA